MVTPSAPGAPRLARTSSQALHRMSLRATLSYRAWNRRCGCCLALRYSTRCKAPDASRPSAFAVDLALTGHSPIPPCTACVDEAGVLPSGRVVLSRVLKRYYDPLRLPLGRPPLPGASGYRRELLPEPRRFGAEEALSSSHDTLLTVPRPLRRRVPWHPLQAPRCRPWPSPSEYRLGSLLAACAVILNDAAGFASCCGPVGCPPRTGGGLPPPRHRDLARRRECCYRGPWRLPGPDSHRLAAVSLSLGYVVVLLL